MQNSNSTSTSNNSLTSKRFVITQISYSAKTLSINCQYFSNGKTATYNHDKAYERYAKSKLATMACCAKYKSYTSSTSVPVILSRQ